MKDKLVDALNSSTLQFMTHKLMMHYYDKGTAVDPNDPAWLNQGVFFWNIDEKFERKSLPPEFKTYSKFPFFIKQIPEDIKISKSQAIPWFGMEGNGDKYCFVKEEKMLPIANANALGAIHYFKFKELTESNIDILQKRELYMLHFKEDSLKYDRGLFYVGTKQISIAKAYEEGLFKILQLGPDPDHD